MTLSDRSDDAPVQFEEWPCVDNSVLGVAMLNLPNALNALNLTMVNLLLAKLTEWQQRDDIGAVLLQASGDKAFCAGGDVVSLHRAMQAHPGAVPEVAREFFGQEYQLDHAIHAFAKPFIVWGSGIVMGGGMGLLMGASHRIVTDTSRLAMPEITIGLFPDVGGSYFLNQMPPGCGLFCGLTGAMINASDALELGLADYFMGSDQGSQLQAQLKNTAWHAPDAVQQLNDYLTDTQQQVSAQMPASPFARHLAAIEPLRDSTSAEHAVAYILSLPADSDQWLSDQWLSRAQGNLRSGSPITMHLVFEQLQRAKGLSLAEVLRMEYTMALNCARAGEFQEGVRALLIDKDRQPNWLFAEVSAVPADFIVGFFEPQWQGEHPLCMLTDIAPEAGAKQESKQ